MPKPERTKNYDDRLTIRVKRDMRQMLDQVAHQQRRPATVQARLIITDYLDWWLNGGGMGK